MKFLALILTGFMSFSLYAQDAVIAVGQAGEEKDKLVIDDTEVKAGDKNLATEFVDILRNDFVFYKHKFNTIDYSEKGKDSFSHPQVEKWAGSGIHFFVTSSFSGGQLSVKAWGISAKKVLLEQSVSINRDNLRASAHRMADQIYRSFTGKPSVFNSKIVFVSDRTSKTKDVEKELYIMDFDGRRVEKLTNFNSVVISPSISHDNSKIMFSLIAPRKEVSRTKTRTIKNIDLKVYDLNTKTFSTVSDRPGINSGAIFSHKGDAIYLTLTFSGNAEIYEMSMPGGKLRKVTSQYSDDVDPSITKDGSLMAFLSNRPGRAHIYTMDPSQTEKNVKRISFVGQFNATPRFSPDGKEIVFTSWVDNGFDLYRIGSQGDNLVRLTKNFGSNEEPVFSPDGEFIVFTSKRVISRTKAVQDIYIMNREGEVLGQLTQDFGRCFSPQWTNILN